MVFDRIKKEAIDGFSYDDKVNPLCELINSFKDHYVANANPSQISVIDESKEALFSTDELASFNMVKEACNDGKWFRFNPFLLQIISRDDKSSKRFSDVIDELPLFIQKETVGPFVMQINFDFNITAPVTNKEKVIVTDDYLSVLINESNRRLILSEEIIDKLFKKLTKLKDI